MTLPVVSPTLVVSEVVSATLVTDGPHAGEACATIRLGGCNLACSWCDVPWAWDSTRYDVAMTLLHRTVHHLLVELLAASPSLVLITGGEPLLQQKSLGWTGLLAGLAAHPAPGIVVEMHTNGTRLPNDATLAGVHRFVVSPKLAHSGEPAWTRIKDEALTGWGALARTRRARFSFVVRDRMDVLTVSQLSKLHGIPPSQIWISPEGRTHEELAAGYTRVVDTVIGHRFNLARRVLLPAQSVS